MKNIIVLLTLMVGVYPTYVFATENALDTAGDILKHQTLKNYVSENLQVDPSSVYYFFAGIRPIKYGTKNQIRTSEHLLTYTHSYYDNTLCQLKVTTRKPLVETVIVPKNKQFQIEKLCWPSKPGVLDSNDPTFESLTKEPFINLFY